MKEKILKAIDKGLLNVLSTDIEDHDIDFDHDNIDNEYILYDAMTVDMGKAGIWCEYNLGAYPGVKPKDWYGNYYAWGETELKNDYSWENYKYCKGTSDTITKYNKTDGLTRLEAKDDIITQTLGNEYRMPTHDEYKKLIKNTTNKQVKNYKGINGLNGRLFTAENGNTLFFPASGSYRGTELYDAGECCIVWSASLYSAYPCCAIYFYCRTDVSSVNDSRYNCLPVRGVKKSFKNK